MPTLFLGEKPIGSIEGVLFDKDGTLSNSEEHLLNLAKLRVQKATSLIGKQGKSLNELNRLKQLLSAAYGLTNEGINPHGIIAIGSRENNLISTATVLCLIGETWPNALELSNKIFQLADSADDSITYNKEKRSLIPGALKILQSLQKENVICALISNDSQIGIQNFLSKNNLSDFFSTIWSADHYPVKPDPAAVGELCKILNLNPCNCALIGDADSDLQMARQAGIGMTLGFTGGWSQRPDLTQHQYLFHNWNELTIQQNIKLTSKSQPNE
tara:strand:+ start:179 stop:994 length:816 start_codon:yes stop_codon:yes gene_type:complete